MDLLSEGGLAIACFENGESVIFLAQSGDVLTCSTEAVEEWRNLRQGALAEMLEQLGHVALEVSSPNPV